MPPRPKSAAARQAYALAMVDAARPIEDSLFAIIDDLVAQIARQARRGAEADLPALVRQGEVAMWRAQLCFATSRRHKIRTKQKGRTNAY